MYIALSMGAKRSAEMCLALKLTKGGMPVYRAAKKAKVYPSSLYRALKSLKEKTVVAS